MTTQEKDWAEEIGAPAYAAIVEMIAALNCDYDRLEELRDQRADLVSEADDDTNAERKEARRALKKWDEENAEELKTLETAAGECKDQDEARQRIDEDALSVEIRSDWHTIGGDKDPGEFRILLTTGGPAVQIRGELDGNSEPARAWLEVQDWGKPWTQYFKADQDTLLAYANCFYYAEE